MIQIYFLINNIKQIKQEFESKDFEETEQKENIMTTQEDLMRFIGEPGMEMDLRTLLHTGHVGEYYEKRMSRMRELMSDSDVTIEQRGAYLSEIERYRNLLHQMRHDVYLYNNGHVVFYDDGWVRWHENNDWRLGD